MAFRTPRDIDRRLAAKLKADIRRKDLIDTFALYRSIQVTAEINQNAGGFMSAVYDVDIKVYSEDYIVYNNVRFSIMDDFIYSRSVRNTMERLRQYFRAYLSNEYPLINFDNIQLKIRYAYFMNTPDGAPQRFSYFL